MKIELVRGVDSIRCSEVNGLPCAAVLKVIAPILGEDIERPAQIALHYKCGLPGQVSFTILGRPKDRRHTAN